MEKDIDLGNLLILGDSYSTFEGHMPQGCGSYYRPSGEPETDVRRVEDTWWHRLISQVECDLVLNHSWTGSTICNTGYDGMDFTDRSFISRFDKLIEEGFFQKNTVNTMLILGGTNDTWAGSPIGEPKWGNWNKEDMYHVAPACAYLMHRVRQVLPDARVCFILNTDLSTDVVRCVRQSLKKFAVENILTELLQTSFECQIVNMDGAQFMIVQADTFEGREEKLQEILQNFQIILQTKFNFYVAITVGSKHLGLNGIHASYLETREAEAFMPALEQDYIDFDEIRDNALRKYIYSMNSEELVYTAIQNDNPALAIAFINKILEEAFGNKGRSSMRRVMVIDIYCTLLKVADEKGKIDKIPVDMSFVYGQHSLKDLMLSFAQIIEAICDGKQPRAEESANTDLCRNVLLYIKKNFSDPDLNVSKVAMEFHLSPSTLSSVYKKETGHSLLRVINDIKIENAVRFLREGYSVSDTALRVGIIDSSSFIRLFKKHMGITPGQYKANFTEDHS